MNYYCLNKNEYDVVCGRKIEGEFAIWFAKHVECVCQECVESWQTRDLEELEGWKAQVVF